MVATDHAKDYTNTFSEHGVETTTIKGSDQNRGDCPLCGKEDHFFINRTNGLWDCKSCGESGNVNKFFRLVTEVHRKTTDTDRYKKLSQSRGIPWGVFKNEGWYWNSDSEHWMLPIVDSGGKIVDVRRYDGKKVMSTSKCSTHLLGENILSSKQKSTRVWVCEGEWDCVALRYFFRRIGCPDIVVSVPGAGTFKKDWAYLFTRKHVILAYDNDEAGRKGSVKAAEFIKPLATTLESISWPEGTAEAYDIRDHVLRFTRGKEPSVMIYKKLLEMVGKTITRETDTGEKEKIRLSEATAEELRAAKPPIGFLEVVARFREWVRVDQTFVDALAVCLAVALGNEVPGDPLWLYLVAPPGSGKTLILMALQTSYRCVFRSTLTPASLVSGFNANPDPSLLPQLDQKTAVFKDGTELLAMHPDAKRETYGVLRGAFDGQVNKSFGNGITRDYKLHFNMIIGMTPAVHGDSQATMGDRFLKYEMRENQKAIEDKIRAAIGNIAKEDRMNDFLCDTIERFLNQQVILEKIPKVPADMTDHIVAISQILAALRAQVDRDYYGERDMRYRPVHEVGTRIAKQLTKMAMMLAMVYGKKTVDSTEYRIIQKIAFDTSIGFHLDILACLIRHQNKPLTKESIGHVCRMPAQTVFRRLADMEQLGLVARERLKDYKGMGLAPMVYKATSMMLNLWNRSAVDWSLVSLRKFPKPGEIGNPLLK